MPIKQLANSKKEALKYFISYLVQSRIRENIAKIILFGSVVKGTYNKNSDIDLLVYGSDKLKDISELCAEAAQEVSLVYQENIEPLVRCIDKIRHPDSYFLYLVNKTGKEVYKMNANEIKNREIQGYRDLASEFIKHAEYDKTGKIYRGTVEAAYNAVELIAKAAILRKLKQLPMSHSGVIEKFSEIYIKTGMVSKELGRELRKLLEQRNNARYEPHVSIGKEEALNSIKFVKDFSEKTNSIFQ